MQNQISGLATLHGPANNTPRIEINHDYQIGKAFVGLDIGDVPPVAEQHRIVAKVDKLFTLCDALKTQLSEAKKQQIQFADAIASCVVG